MSRAMKIRQIVKLKQVMKRWKIRCTPVRSRSRFDSSDSDSSPTRPPSRIRPGFIAVYVGDERCRFWIPTRFMNLPIFISLLKKSAEEFGYQSCGALVLPCEVGFFESLLKDLEKDEQRFKRLDLDEVLRRFSEVGLDPCKEGTSSSSQLFTPLLQKTRV